MIKFPCLYCGTKEKREYHIVKDIVAMWALLEQCKKKYEEGKL